MEKLESKDLSKTHNLKHICKNNISEIDKRIKISKSLQKHQIKCTSDIYSIENDKLIKFLLGDTNNYWYVMQSLPKAQLVMNEVEFNHKEVLDIAQKMNDIDFSSDTQIRQEILNTPSLAQILVKNNKKKYESFIQEQVHLSRIRQTLDVSVQKSSHEISDENTKEYLSKIAEQILYEIQYIQNLSSQELNKHYLIQIEKLKEDKLYEQNVLKTLNSVINSENYVGLPTYNSLFDGIAFSIKVQTT